MVKTALKSCYYSALSLLGADKRRLRKIKEENLIVILNLHRISPEKNPFWSPLSPEMFKNLLGFLQKEFEVCLFRELKERKNSAKPLAILSFDDGYHDFIQYAVPILEKHNIKANVNIIPKSVAGGEPLWNTQLYDFLNVAPRNLVNEIQLPDFTPKLTGDSNEAKLSFGLKISKYFKNRPKEERNELLEIIKPYQEKCDFPRTAMLSTCEVKEISKIHEIGAHSFSHESMRYESNEFFLQDLNNCKTFFEQDLRIPLSIYSFPNGSYRLEQIKLLRKNNIEHILLVKERLAKSNSDVYPRLTFYARSEAEMRLKTLGF